MNTYLAKVKVRLDVDDKIKKVTEIYLVKAESVTDVEVLITKSFENENLEWELVSVTTSKIRGVINFNK